MSTAAITPLPKPELPVAPRSPEFESALGELREAMVCWMWSALIYRVTRGITRRPPWHVTTTTQRLTFAVAAISVRFLVPVAATILTWSWMGAPIWTWLTIVALMTAFDVLGTRLGSETSLGRATALAAAIDRERDLSELVAFTRRWWRLRIVSPVSVVIAVVVLGTAALIAPADFQALHPGSLALLAYLLYEYGESASMRIVMFSMFVREARYQHRLSWLSPLESAPVQTVLGIWRQTAFGGGLMAALTLTLSVILIDPDTLTVLLAPFACLVIVSFVVDTLTVLSVRRSIERIVRHNRDATLDRLRQRIDTFGPRLEKLSLQESDELQRLMATYAAVQKAPTGPSGAETFGHALTALAIPAIAFFLAVMSEVYAERVLDQLLP